MLWLLKLLNPRVLAIRQGRVSAIKGYIPSMAMREVQGLIDETGASRGTIHTDGAGRHHFSASIPGDFHQRLRNILTSL